MPKGVYKRSAETLAKHHPFLGHHHSVDAKARIIEAARNPSDETRAKKSKSKIGNTNAIGSHRTNEEKEALRQRWVGNKINLGRIPSKETRRKMGLAHKGEKNHNWTGGYNEGYTTAFNKELKELIRERDNHECQICHTPEVQLTEKLTSHHINYVKADCRPSNLVSLCRPCHTKTNNRRTYWEAYFISLMLQRKKPDLKEVIRQSVSW